MPFASVDKSVDRGASVLYMQRPMSEKIKRKQINFRLDATLEAAVGYLQALAPGVKPKPSDIFRQAVMEKYARECGDRGAKRALAKRGRDTTRQQFT